MFSSLSLSSCAFASKSVHCQINDFKKLDDTLTSCSSELDHSTGYRARRSIRSVIISARDTKLLPTLVEQTPNVTHNQIHPNASSIDHSQLCDWRFLGKIQLNEVSLTKLPSYFLLNCQKLDSLVRGQVKSKDIAKDAFGGLSELSSLSLKENEISVISFILTYGQW